MKESNGRESAELFSRLRDGDKQSADELFDRYAARLIALARARLSPRILKRVDAEDVAQSAWRSFFVGAAAGRFSVERGGDLWRLLVTITLHKLHRQVRRHTAERRNVGAEEPLDLVEESLILHDNHQPRPEEAVALVDELEAVMFPLDELARRVLELRLRGEHIEAIATATGRSERTVRRKLVEIRQGLQRRAEFQE